MTKSPLTYAGALALLGKHDHPLLEKANTLLGGAILAGTPVAGPTAWAFIEPKNELIDVAKSLLDTAKNRMLGTSGYERRELLTAAHTVLVISAFFDGVAEALGANYRLLKLTDEEKLLLTGAPTSGERTFIWQILSIDIELPSVDRELGLINRRFRNLASATVEFIRGLAIGDQVTGGSETFAMAQRIVDRAEARYRDAYLRFAVDVPEFALWISWTSDAAILESLRATRADIVALLSDNSNALTKLHDLLKLAAPGALPGVRSNRELLAATARGVLGKPLLRFNAGENTPNITFPTVGQGFVTPRFRFASYGKNSLPASDLWWSIAAVRTDLDAFLAAHLASADSAELPLLILGDPGAGKSLLTEVLAARLPTGAFTVFRVELRDVTADKKVPQQISEAMSEALDKDVQWGDLTEECHGTIRVVILDGFDELVLATGVTRSAYVEEVVDFQRKELDRERPVAVIITSRTLVADRARIPLDCLMIKLEEFGDEQIEAWLREWNRANIATPGFRALAVDEVTHHRDLSRQPLLLLILAVYAADLGAERLDSQDLSGARLYQRLLDTFVRRQVDKSLTPQTRGQVSDRMAYHRWQLGMTAFGMFNRGLQHITEAELEADLAAFVPNTTNRERVSFDAQLSEAGQTISSFFFIQSSSATEGRGRRQAYEFLHSTFAEYLIAEHTMQLLTALADQFAKSSETFPLRDVPDDDRVFALLSHQALAKRWPITQFTGQMYVDLDPDQQQNFRVVIIELLRRASTRQEQRKYERYEPTPYNIIRRLANYTVNLTTLLVMLPDKALSPIDLAPPESNPVSWWQSMVSLWEAGLDSAGWASILDSFTLSYDKKPLLQAIADGVPGTRAQLAGRHAEQLQLDAGKTLINNTVSVETDDDVALYRAIADMVMVTTVTAPLSRLLPQDEETLGRVADMLADGTRLNDQTEIVLWQALARLAAQLPFELVSRFLPPLLANPWSALGCELAAVIAAHPQLLANAEVSGLAEDNDFGYGVDAPLTVAILWQAERNAVGPELDALRAFRQKFDEMTASVLDDFGSLWLPPEFLTYLRLERPSHWAIDAPMLSSLTARGAYELKQVDPLDALYLAEAYSRSHEAVAGPADAEKRLTLFVAAYLAAHDQPTKGAQPGSALDELRAYAEWPWKRP